MALNFGLLQPQINPVADLMGGIAGGAQLGQLEQQAQQQRLELEQKQRQEQAMRDFMAIENPQSSDYARMITQNPSLAEPYTKAYKVMDQGKKDATLQQASTVFSLLNSGNTEKAKDYINELSLASANSGDQQTSDSMQAISQMMDINPEAAKRSMGMFIASNLGADKFTEAFSAMGKEQRAQDLHPIEREIKKQDFINKALDAGLTKADINKRMAEAKKIGVEIDNADDLINFKKEELLNKKRELSIKERAQDYKEKKPLIERQQAMPKARRFAESFQQKHDNVNQTIFRAIQLAKPLSASFGSKALSEISGTEAKDLRSLINTIEANVAFSALQEMRQNSPTGGALGSIAVKELEMLGDTVQDLDPTQSISQLTENLLRSAKFLKEQNSRIQQSFQDDYGDLIQESAPTEPVASPEGIKFLGFK